MSKTAYPQITALRQFVEIQNAGGIARAAQRLGLTQPALSRNIRRLEAIVGTPLLDRHSRGTDLTPAGRSFLTYASRILLDAEHGMESARKAAGIARQELRIGAGALFSHAIIPNVLPVFEPEFPDHKISIKTVPYDDIANIVMDRQVDICVHGLPTKHADALVAQRVLHGKRSIICARTHPIANVGRKVKASDLSEFPFVAFPRARNQMEDIDRIFHENRLTPPRIVFETDRLFSALRILENGRYLMYGSALLVTSGLNPNLITVPTQFDLGTYEIGFTYRVDFELDSAAKRFLAVSRTMLKRAVLSANTREEIGSGQEQGEFG